MIDGVGTSILVTIGVLSVFSGFVIPQTAAITWTGFSILYCLLSFRMHQIFLENFKAKSRFSINRTQVRNANHFIKIILGNSLLFIVSTGMIFVLKFAPANTTQRAELANELKSFLNPSIFSSIEFEVSSMFSNSVYGPWTYFLPLSFFGKLLILDVSIIILLKYLSRKFEFIFNNNTLFVMLFYICILIPSFFTYISTKFLPSKSFLILTLSYLWILCLAPLALSLEEKKWRFDRRKVNLPMILILLVLQFHFLDFSTAGILPIVDYCIFAILILVIVLDLSSRREALELNPKNKAYKWNFKAKIIQVGFLFYLTCYPFAIFLQKSLPISTFNNSLYLSLALSLPLVGIVISFASWILNLTRLENFLFDFVWSANSRERTNFRFVVSAKAVYVLLGATLLCFSTLLTVDLLSKKLKDEVEIGLETSRLESSVALGIVPPPSEPAQLPPLEVSSSRDTQSNDLPKSEMSQVISTSDFDWQKKIVQGIQVVQSPTSISRNLPSLTADRSFSSPTCQPLTSQDFQAVSEVTFCRSELLGAPLALFIGNSHGAMLQDVMAQTLNGLGYSEFGIFTSSCTISPNLIPVLGKDRVSKCKFFAEDLARYIVSKKPAIIIISQSINISFSNSAGGSVAGLSAEKLITSNLAKSIRSYQSFNSKVVLIDSFPQLPNITSCMGPSGRLNNCVSSVSSTEIYRRINKKVASDTGSVIVSPMSWLCYQGRCPAIIDGTLVSPDGSHLTPEFALTLRPLIEKSLAKVS
ncbi:SGNH domain containing protein [Candidatus Nanopelagicaceae bacterium]